MNNFLSSNELCATNTFFKKKSYATKHCSLRNDFYTTDFIFVEQKSIKYVCDAGVSKSHINSDHRGVFISFNCEKIYKKNKFAKETTASPIETKISWLNLRDEDKRKAFQVEVASLFYQKESYPNLASSISTAAKRLSSIPVRAIPPGSLSPPNHSSHSSPIVTILNANSSRIPPPLTKSYSPPPVP